MKNDITLATGTMVSAAFSFNPATKIRTADFVENMTPTLAGTVPLHSSIQAGTKLEENLTTLPDVFHPNGVVGPGMVNWVTGGDAVMTLDPPSTILPPNLPSSVVHHDEGPKFLHG
jgi:hypothetical protein